MSFASGCDGGESELLFHVQDSLVRAPRPDRGLELRAGSGGEGARRSMSGTVHQFGGSGTGRRRQCQAGVSKVM